MGNNYSFLLNVEEVDKTPDGALVIMKGVPIFLKTKED